MHLNVSDWLCVVRESSPAQGRDCEIPTNHVFGSTVIRIPIFQLNIHNMHLMSCSAGAGDGIARRSFVCTSSVSFTQVFRVISILFGFSYYSAMGYILFSAYFVYDDGNNGRFCTRVVSSWLADPIGPLPDIEVWLLLYTDSALVKAVWSFLTNDRIPIYWVVCK